jgi:hypothetical protein
MELLVRGNHFTVTCLKKMKICKREGWMKSFLRMDLVEVGWGDVDWLRIGTGGELL